MGVVLVTGASSGLGRAAAGELDRRGHRVYGGSRSPAPGSGPTVRMEAVRLDVDDDASVEAAFREIVDREGRLDAVVNAAGFGIAGAIEDTRVEEARAQFETNVFGVLRVCRAALPVFRRQGAGTIVNVSSIAGRVSLPFQGFYSASKFALEGLTEALRMEVRPFGVRVVLVEPGDFATGFTDARRTVAAAADGPYRERFTRALAAIERDERGAATPEAVGRLIADLVVHPAPRLRYTVGPALQRATPALKALLPGGVFESLIVDHYAAR